MSPPVVPSKRILIIRLSAIGDVIMASGVIPCLRTAFPDATLVWLTEEGNEDLLRHNPQLNRVLVWPRRRWRTLYQQHKWLTLWREFRRFRQELRRQRFDWVLDLQGLLKSALWAWLTGAERRVGFGSKEGAQWLMTEVVDRNIHSDLLGKEYRRMMQVLHAAPSRFAMDVAVSFETGERAEALLREEGVERGYVVFCPFTTRPQKHWFDERWSSLCRLLGNATGLMPVLLGGPTDRLRAEAMAAASGVPVGNLCGKTRLDDCAAVIRGARLLIGVDTGLTHLGIAMQRPTLALFGSTVPYLETGSPAGRVLYEKLACSPCHRRPTCNGAFTCMDRHTVQNVLTAALELLEAASSA
ncbi:MAG: lipopolysaccharide heptosyltransferase I [Methylotetracoccus sp.]|nr:lipopolysaccharide heptosyltransferase I [Methylotetracoccus sp.]